MTPSRWQQILVSDVEVFRKKPVRTPSLKWTGKNREEVEEFCGSDAKFDAGGRDLKLKTLEDNKDTWHHVSVGDWICKGVANEFWAVKPDVFRETYEKV